MKAVATFALILGVLLMLAYSIYQAVSCCGGLTQ
jgi:hypothetical protein